MTTIIAPLDANKLYGKLVAIHDETKRLMPNESSLDCPLYVHRIKDFQKVYEDIIAKATEDLPSKTSIFDRINIIVERHALSKYASYLHQTRKHCNEARHWETRQVPKYKPEYESCIQCTANFIAQLSDVPVLDSVKSIYWVNNPTQNNPPKPIYIKKQVEKKILTEEEKEIQDYPNERLPIVILLDESGSMGHGSRIADINKGIQLLGKSLYDNETTRNAVELSIITFGHEVKEVVKFSRLENQIKNIQEIDIKAIGNSTNLGEAVNKALIILEERKKKIRDNGGSYWQPWLFIITDSDGSYIDDYKQAAEKANELESQKKPKLTVFPVLIGDGNSQILKEFSSKRSPYELSDSAFEAFFYWIFKEAKYVSQSQGVEQAGNIPKDLRSIQNEFKEIRK